MKRIVPAIIIVLAVAVLSLTFFRPRMAERVETWETSNQSFRVRIDRHKEGFGGFVPGAYYVFQFANLGSDRWVEVMTFRHDDPVPIPRDAVRFVNERTGYIFMGWKYAVTTDGGVTWRVWNAEEHLPNWQCCNYGLIKYVRVEPAGTGEMILNPIPQRRGEVQALQTTDYGKHWSH